MTAAQLLFWMADNVAVWAKYVVLILAAFLITLPHAVAIMVEWGEQ